jgi:hypothetical protein
MMGHMPPNYFFNARSPNGKKKVILKVEYDLKQCAHIP